MARYKLQGRARDTWGNAISDLDIYIYVAGTNRLQTAIVYTSNTSTTPLSAAPQLSSDSYGTFKFWVDDTDYVASTTKFDIYADGLEYTYIDIFNIKHHGTMGGLKFDDHPRYPSVSAAEVITGAWNFTIPPCGNAPSAGKHLVNKEYVDTSVASISAGEGLIESPDNVLNVNPGNGIEILFDAVTVKQDEVDHGSIGGLGDDDHTQYSRADGTRAFTGTVGGISPVADSDLVTKYYLDSNFPSAAIPSAGGPVVVTNNWYFTVPASGVSPSADNHLAIKQYVDNAVLSVSAGGGLIEPTPNTFAVNPDNTTIQITSDEVTVIQGGLDHVNIQSIGTNTHAQIDSTLSSIESSAADINTTLNDHIASASVHVSQTYIDSADASTLASANSYTDTASANLQSYADAGDAATLASANSYTDTASANLQSYADAGDAATLASASSYADATSANALFQANQYTDLQVVSVSASVAADYLRQDGTTPLEGDWDVGPHTITVGGDVHISGSLYTSGASIYTSAIHPLTSPSAAIAITDGGPVELYYDGAKALETTADGVTVYADSGEGLDFHCSVSGYNEIISTENSQQLHLKVRDSSGVEKHSLLLNPEGSVVGYHDGLQAFVTEVGGFRVYGSTTGYNCQLHFGATTFRVKNNSGDAVQILGAGDTSLSLFNNAAGYYRFYHDTDNDHVGFSLSYPDALLENIAPSGSWEISSNNNSNTPTTVFRGDPEGSAELYYAGNKVAETTENGFTITTSGGTNVAVFTDSTCQLYDDGVEHFATESYGASFKGSTNPLQVRDNGSVGNWSLNNLTHGGTFTLSGENTSGVATTGLIFDPDGSTSIYHEGEKTLSTIETITGTTGISIFGPSGTGQTDLHQAIGQADFAIDNKVEEGWIFLNGTNTSSATRSMLTGDPDGEVRMYHPGTNTLVLKSQSKGILTGSSQNIAILSETGYASIYNTGHGDSIRLTGENGSGTPTILFEGDPDGAAELYHGGSKVAETTENGFTVTTSAGVDLAVFDVDSQVIGNNFQLLDIDPVNSTTELGYTNNTSFKTDSSVPEAVINVNAAELLNIQPNRHILGRSDQARVDISSSGTTFVRLYSNGSTLAVDAGNDGVKLEKGVRVDEFSNDSTMSDASPSAVPTEYAVRTFVESVSAARDEHNELKNIQGGIPSASEYYHLDAQLYNQLSSTATAVLLSGGIDVDGHSAIGNNADIDFGIPGLGYGLVLNVDENFDSSYTNLASGIYLNIDNAANDAGAISVGVSSTVQNGTSTLHDWIAGSSNFANSTAASASITSILGTTNRAGVTGNNSTITNMIGGDFDVVTASGMVNLSITDMIGGRFQILKAPGSGETNITNGYGALIKTPGYTSSGTTTNLYGLYIEDQSTVGFANDYNFYSAGANSENKFEGNVDIDGTLGVDSIDSTSLAISGDVHLTGSLYTSGASVYTSAIHPLSSEIVIGESTGTNLLIDSANKEATIILDGEDTSDSVFHTEPASGSESYNWIGVLGNQLYWSTDSTGSNDFHIDLNDDNILRGDPTGALELYYAGSKVVETISTGISITDGVATPATIDFSGDNLRIKNNAAGGDFAVLTRNTANDTDYTRISMDGDAGMTFYYGGSTVSNSKIQITLAGLAVYGANTGAQGNFSFSGNDLYIDNLVDGADIYMRGQVATDTYQTIFKGAPDGAAELYYNNNKVFETSATGIKTGSDLSTFTIETTAGWAGIKIKSTGNVDFHYENVKVLSTTAKGLQWALTSPFEITNYTGWTGVAITSAGAAELYYNDDKKFETTSTGAEVTGDLEYLNISTATAQATASNADVILADGTGGSFTVYLTEKDRAIIRVKKIDSSNTITIQGLSGTIDGSANKTLTVQYESMTFVSDGSNWYIV